MGADSFVFFDISDIGDAHVEEIARRIAALGFEVENCFVESLRKGGSSIGRSSSYVEYAHHYSIEFSNDEGQFGIVLVIRSEFVADKRNPYDGKACAAVRAWGGYSHQMTDETKALLGDAF